MDLQKYAAVDLGAESGRVMVGEVSAEGIHLTEVHRFPNLQIRVPVGSAGAERLHWDILRLWHEIKTGLAKAADEHELAGIGVDTWGVDFGLLDGDGELLGNPVCYRDGRTQGVVEKVFAGMSQQAIYETTGIQTMALNTLFQLASLSLGKSGQLAAAKYILFLPDLLTYWLCGKMGTEYTIASTSQMLDAKSRKWSEEVFAAIGLSPALFPPIDMPGEKTSLRGKVLASVNEKLAARGTPVFAVGSHDTASAVAAVPAQGESDWLYLSSGTWSLLGAETREPVLTAAAARYNVTNEGGVGGKIRLLKNIAGLWLLQECKRQWEREGREWDYAAITRMAGEAAPRMALLDLDDPAFATPGNMPAKIVAQCQRTGQRAPATPGEFARVILESLAASYGKVIAMLQEITGKTFRRLHIVGGGSRNELLNQMAADATGLEVLAGPVEATALGNILTQALAAGQITSLDQGRELVARTAGVKAYHPGK
ncbi:MAG TPA: rhamnulokinase family protein [Phycisphaerae bacterium]|nr:rhamnulokinase family protein [Phycisphaerae bacterium]